MNTSAIKHTFGRTVHAPAESAECSEKKRVRYASDKAVQKAHKRAIQKFASMFRKLAE
jgi:hypothetical protein